MKSSLLSLTFLAASVSLSAQTYSLQTSPIGDPNAVVEVRALASTGGGGSISCVFYGFKQVSYTCTSTVAGTVVSVVGGELPLATKLSYILPVPGGFFGTPLQANIDIAPNIASPGQVCITAQASNQTGSVWCGSFNTERFTYQSN